MLNLKQLLDISSTEKSSMLIESQRLAIETRTIAAAEARVAQEASRLRMDKAKILVQVVSDTHKWTGAPVGFWEDLVMSVLRNGLDDAAIIQSEDTCIDDVHRTRLDTKAEPGQSALYRNPPVTDCGTHCPMSKKNGVDHRTRMYVQAGSAGTSP